MMTCAHFNSNNAGGITGGLTTGQPIVARLVVKPTPTIDTPQRTIDKYTLENKVLAAITRRDPTIVARVWPVAEAMTAIILLDHLTMHLNRKCLSGDGRLHLCSRCTGSQYPSQQAQAK